MISIKTSFSSFLDILRYALANFKFNNIFELLFSSSSHLVVDEVSVNNSFKSL